MDSGTLKMTLTFNQNVYHIFLKTSFIFYLEKKLHLFSFFVNKVIRIFNAFPKEVYMENFYFIQL